ncbi:hypothetical protein GLYMA_10G129500v4 [Glycine max]|uniref:Uncharacterized protein n=1 Tax=Glycine max TaxID=3847 RepID=K7LJ40_SOYBN|nr:hypothetical protein JHK85_028666 [Glycine max]KAG5003990.1 hypothetical protein JHK86_028129 [Glycine max]KAH1138005.1 hypothetical protein GYH30_027846 [Glycine max]KRH33532.1 hypothetical protein GLYMA_10G129500v4 [Glycine max]
MVVVGYHGYSLLISPHHCIDLLPRGNHSLLISPHHCIDLLPRGNLKIDQCPYSTLCSSSSRMCLPHLQLVCLLE